MPLYFNLDPNKEDLMKVKGMILAALFAAVTAVLAQISVPVPVSAVPFSLGIVGVYLSGALLAPKEALISQLIYILLGVVGLPVFSQFRGGFSVLAGPTGGYLFVYPVMALIISAICAKAKKRSFPVLLVSMLPALAVCYTAGSLWLAFISGITVPAAFAAGALPFIIPDIVKIILSSLLAAALYRALRKQLNYKA